MSSVQNILFDAHLGPYLMLSTDILIDVRLLQDV